MVAASSVIFPSPSVGGPPCIFYYSYSFIHSFICGRRGRGHLHVTLQTHIHVHFRIMKTFR